MTLILSAIVRVPCAVVMLVGMSGMRRLHVRRGRSAWLWIGIGIRRILTEVLRRVLCPHIWLQVISVGCAVVRVVRVMRVVRAMTCAPCGGRHAIIPGILEGCVCTIAIRIVTSARATAYAVVIHSSRAKT